MKKTVFMEFDRVPEVRELEGGYIEFDCKSVDSWLPENLATKVSELSVNLPVFWRHRTPQKPEYTNYPVLGRVIASRVENGEIYNTFKVGGNSHPAQVLAREWVKSCVNERVPAGISVGVVCMYQGDELIDAEPLEYSLTPYPACETCTTESECKLAPGGEEMTEKETNTPDELQEQLDNLAEKEKELEEVHQKKLGELEAKARELEMLEKELEERKKEIESKSVENEALKAAIAELENKIVALEKKPVLERIKELEDEDTWKFFEKEYGSKDIACLKSRLAALEKRKKAAPPIIVEEVKETTPKLSVKEILEFIEDEDTRRSLKKFLDGDA